MTDNKPWTDQWFKAQRQFVDAWSDMASGGSKASQSDLWAQSFDMWRKACEGRTQPDVEQAMRKCMDMGREYFAMAEQISKQLAEGASPVEAIDNWLEQVKKSLQQFAGVPGFNGAAVGDFMKQWFTPNATWQDMVASLTPMNQALWQMPGMNTSVLNLGDMIDPLGRILEAPGVGYFREPQEKLQKGMQLALDYQQANYHFNQAFLRVALESIQGFQARLTSVDGAGTPGSLREIYDLWVEVSEEHYAEFAMSEEYQALYGDMVNKLMTMRKHYGEIVDDNLRALNLPNTREIDTMQERLQQLRRDNFALKKQIADIRAELAKLNKKPLRVTAQSSSDTKKPAVKKSAAKKSTAKRSTAKQSTAKKSTAKQPTAKKSTRTKAGA